MAHLWTSPKTSADFGNSPLVNQCFRLHKGILLGLRQVESGWSQTFSEKVKDCRKKGSNLRRLNTSPVLNHNAIEDLWFTFNQNKQLFNKIKIDKKNNFAPKLFLIILVSISDRMFFYTFEK